MKVAEETDQMQLFMVIAVPVAGWSYPQFVPGQVTVYPQTVPQTHDTCPYCKTTLSLGWKFCPQCGASLVCPDCKTSIQPGNKYCPNCGKALKR